MSAIGRDYRIVELRLRHRETNIVGVVRGSHLKLLDALGRRLEQLSQALHRAVMQIRRSRPDALQDSRLISASRRKRRRSRRSRNLRALNMKFEELLRRWRGQVKGPLQVPKGRRKSVE